MLQIGEKPAMQIRYGVPQGSIIGPTLWNIYYNEFVKLEMQEDISILGYADDVAPVAVAKTE